MTVRTLTFDDEESFHAYLSEILAKSVTSREDAQAAIDNCTHVFSLVTCNYLDEMGGDGRTIVICIPKSELPEQG
jgi:sortase B